MDFGQDKGRQESVIKITGKGIFNMNKSQGKSQACVKFD